MIRFEGNKKEIRGRSIILKRVLKDMCTEHSHQVGFIQYVFVDDEFLLDLNKQVLQHDYYTDIITFDYSQNGKIEGEIYISTDRVHENAIKYKSEFHVELARVIFHGVLHMLGYKDKSKKESEIMRTMENKYLKKYNEMFHVEH